MRVKQRDALLDKEHERERERERTPATGERQVVYGEKLKPCKHSEVRA